MGRPPEVSTLHSAGRRLASHKCLDFVHSRRSFQDHGQLPALYPHLQGLGFRDYWSSHELVGDGLCWSKLAVGLTSQPCCTVP